MSADALNGSSLRPRDANRASVADGDYDADCVGSASVAAPGLLCSPSRHPGAQSLDNNGHADVQLTRHESLSERRSGRSRPSLMLPVSSTVWLAGDALAPSLFRKSVRRLRALSQALGRSEGWFIFVSIHRSLKSRDRARAASLAHQPRRRTANAICPRAIR